MEAAARVPRSVLGGSGWLVLQWHGRDSGGDVVLARPAARFRWGVGFPGEQAGLGCLERPAESVKVKVCCPSCDNGVAREPASPGLSPDRPFSSCSQRRLCPRLLNGEGRASLPEIPRRLLRCRALRRREAPCCSLGRAAALALRYYRPSCQGTVFSLFPCAPKRVVSHCSPKPRPPHTSPRENHFLGCPAPQSPFSGFCFTLFQGFVPGHQP